MSSAIQRNASEAGERGWLWGILAGTAIVYLRCLGNGFVLDDVVMQVKNPDLHTWSFLWKGFTRSEFWYSDAGFLQAQEYRNYRPVLLAWYWLDYHLFGLNPGLWHASIVAVHLVAVWLVFKIARRLGGDATAALIAAALFALTPIHAGAVVWVAACGMVIGSALTLAAFYFIVAPRDDLTPNPFPWWKGDNRVEWAAAIACYAGALLCHESMTVFPAIVAAYAFLCGDEGKMAEGPEEKEDRFAQVPPLRSGRQRGERARRAVVWTAPFAIELIVYFVARRMALGFFIGNPYDMQNTLSDAQAILTVPAVFVTYIAMLAMPWLTLPNHRVMPVSSALSSEFWMPVAAIAVAAAALVAVAMRSRRRGLYLFCGAWIAITLTPMLLLHSVPHLVQDYTLYLPSVGFCILLGDLIAGVADKNAIARRFAFGAVAAMLIVYAAVLWKAEGFWHDDVSASRGYVEGSPESVGWRWTLATHLDQQGDWAGAEKEIRTALALEPDRTGITHPHSSNLHHFLGELLARHGDIDGAVLELDKSMSGPKDEDEVHPTRPPLKYDWDASLKYFHSLDEAKLGQTNDAIGDLKRASEMMKAAPVPDYGPIAQYLAKLAEFYDAAGNQEQVEAVLKEAGAMPEGELEVGLARARIRLNHSDKEGAAVILRELSGRYPDNYQVLTELGDLEFKLKHYQEAFDCYYRAGAGWFAGPQLHLSMAQSLHAMRREREALDQCRMADALAKPDSEVRSSCAEMRKNVAGK
jgi:Flp pilus assembly protein TadD